ncbi:MAG: tRNA 2-thiouridine(34) synthase MnmA, partial [Planctomycetaceae bacterium]
FIGERNFKEFLKNYLPAQPGEIRTMDGRDVGRHEGLMYYTIGQRKGLGIGTEHVRYVVALDAANARVIVGSRKQAMAKGCRLTDCIFPAGLPKEKQLGARVRYRSPEVKAQTRVEGDKVLLEFDEPQFAVTAGQSAVLYDDDVVIGGGIIDAVLT